MRIYQGLITLSFIVLVACGGGSDSSTPGNGDENNNGGNGQGGPLTEQLFIHRLITLSDVGSQAGYGEFEFDFLFYNNNEVDFRPRDTGHAYATTYRMTWEIQGNTLYLNSGSQNTGAVWESPKQLVFEAPPHKGQVVAFMTGPESTYIDTEIVVFREIDPRPEFTLSNADFVGWVYAFNVNGSPEGIPLTSVTFLADQTAIYQPEKSSDSGELVQWEFSSDHTVRLYDFSYSPTYQEYEFTHMPADVGDEVFVTTVIGSGQTAKTINESTRLVRKYESTSGTVNLAASDFAGWTYELDVNGLKDSPYKTVIRFNADYTAVSGSDTVSWEIIASDTIRLSGFPYDSPLYEEYRFTRMPAQIGDAVFGVTGFNSGPIEGSTTLVDLYRSP